MKMRVNAGWRKMKMLVGAGWLNGIKHGSGRPD